jgi:hypothetical protein
MSGDKLYKVGFEVPRSMLFGITTYHRASKQHCLEHKKLHLVSRYIVGTLWAIHPPNLCLIYDRKTRMNIEEVLCDKDIEIT